jgi:hypothetical protein
MTRLSIAGPNSRHQDESFAGSTPGALSQHRRPRRWAGATEDWFGSILFGLMFYKPRIKDRFRVQSLGIGPGWLLQHCDAMLSRMKLRWEPHSRIKVRWLGRRKGFVNTCAGARFWDEPAQRGLI